MAVVVAGCEFLPVSVGNRAHDFCTPRPTYAISDTVRASFDNRSLQPVYLVEEGCPPRARLERQAKDGWTEVRLPIACSFVPRPPILVDAGERYDPLTYRPAHQAELADTTISSGTYRLALDVGRSEDEATRVVTSDAFELVAE
jgi:hypothetical protein